MSYADDVAVAFAMHCDLKDLSRTEGIMLAERLSETIEAAALDRPEDNRDPEELAPYA